jgi:multiple sugar transport system permease protein
MFTASRTTVVGFLFLAVACLVVFRLVPVGIAVVGSFYGESLTGDRVFRGLGNFVDLFADEEFLDGIVRTLLFNLLINPIQIGLAFILAMLVLDQSKATKAFRVAFFLPMCISLALASVLWSVLLDPSLGLVNGVLSALGAERQLFFRAEGQALWSMILLATWKSVGYWMIFILAGLVAIPGDIYEAASLDGATGLRSFTKITLPLMKRPLLFVLVADTTANFLFFAPVYLITGGGPNNSTNFLMFQAYRSSFVLVDHGRSLAISTLILLMIALVAALEFRLFRADGEQS